MLRKKPPGQLLKSAHAVDREYRVMKGLEDTDVPVPRMLHLCEDDGVLGTAFFVMEFVDGTVFWDPALPELTNAQRTKVYDEQNRALAALHLVDPAKVGLADFGKAGSYFARQRDRWTKQYRASETEHHRGHGDADHVAGGERAARRRPRLASCTATTASTT